MQQTKAILDAYPSVQEFERQLTLAVEFSERPGAKLHNKRFLSQIQSSYDERGWTLQLSDQDRFLLRRLSEGIE